MASDARASDARASDARANSSRRVARKTSRWVVTTLVAILGVSCGPARTLESFACPDGGTALTWRNFGASFFARRCKSCHAAEAVDRQGAPRSYTFDTVEEVHKWRVRIFERAAAENDTMPPGPDDPPLHERMQLAQWLACGAF